MMTMFRYTQLAVSTPIVLMVVTEPRVSFPLGLEPGGFEILAELHLESKADLAYVEGLGHWLPSPHPFEDCCRGCL